MRCPLDFSAEFTLMRVCVTECTVLAEWLKLYVFMSPDEQRSSVNESSSLLGGSPHRHCRRKSSPYHTGQLHPAVRVADLLQHINQMKTAEGYGFKQEYEVRKEKREKVGYYKIIQFVLFLMICASAWFHLEGILRQCRIMCFQLCGKCLSLAFSCFNTHQHTKSCP